MKSVKGKTERFNELIDDLNPHRLRLEIDEDSNRSRHPLDIVLYIEY